MRLHRTVPLSSGLRVSYDLLDHPSLKGKPDPFQDYAHEHRLFEPGTTLDRLQQVLPGVPRTLMGQAWVDEMTKVIDLTHTDAWRGYDEAEYDTDREKWICGQIAALANEVEAASPLLADVAGRIHNQVPYGRFALAEVAAARACITDQGIALNDGEGGCDKHDDCRDRGPSQWVPWEHLHALFPGLRPRLEGLLHALDESLPPLVEGDNGKSRMTSARD